MLAELGCESVELRQRKDIDDIDGLILPGGESTVQGKLLRDLGMFQPLQQLIRSGLPVLATCAGLILLAQHLADDTTVHFGTMPVTVRRNAYGRQLGSFQQTAPLKGIGDFTMTFIRAPYITQAAPDVDILATIDDRIVAAPRHRYTPARKVAGKHQNRIGPIRCRLTTQKDVARATSFCWFIKHTAKCSIYIGIDH